MASEARTAVVAALLVNGALTALKGVVAGLTGSAAMLAETFHSAAETEDRVRRPIAEDAAVAGVVELLTLHLGPRAILVAARGQSHDELRAPDIARAVPRIEDRVCPSLGGATSRRLVLIEPALPGPDAAERAA